MYAIWWKQSSYRILFFHDSRLFSDIDETHCEVLFDIVRNKFKTKQYIASINQKDLKTLAEPIQDFIRQNMVCELNDESEEGKLLGRQVEFGIRLVFIS